MRLPDKEYLTFKELAERWNCDESDLFHYVATRKLVPSIFVSGNYESFMVEQIETENAMELGLCSNFTNEYKEGIFFLNLAEHKERRECTFRYFSKERILGDFSFCNAFKQAINLYLRDDNLVHTDDNLIFVHHEIIRFESEYIQKFPSQHEEQDTEEILNDQEKLRISEETKKLAEALTDPDFKASIVAKLEYIQERNGVPTILHDWFKHDTWKIQEGLMLLSGLSPNSIFEIEENSYGTSFRKMVTLITLDGLEHDPRTNLIFDSRLEMYERLWHSGDHPSRATPKYFIDWALSKNIPPSWLDWSKENNYYAQIPINSDKAIDGKSETAYLNIIGALVDLYWQTKRPTEPKINQSEIINELTTKYDGFHGLSERNLKSKLSKAIKSIKNE